MKPKFDEWLMSILFCGFLLVMSALFFLLPKTQFSETEKRYLQDPPKYSFESLASGQLGYDIESYMADHIPGRDFFVGLYSYFERLTLRQVSEDIYLAEGERLVEKPVIWDEDRITRNVNSILSFANHYPNQVDIMIVPSGGWAVRDRIIGISNPYCDEEIISGIYGKLPGVNTVDITEMISSYPDPAELYYRTDHHWTSLGAYKAYCHYVESKGLSAIPEKEFTVKTVEDFKGTTHSRSALWLIPGEPLQMWSGPASLTVTNRESQESHQGPFYMERLKEQDKYTVFLDGNHSLVRIENPEKEEKILVFRDSYANCLGSFLAQSYGTVVLVDLRYYKEPLETLWAEETFDDTLICYSLSNFMTDNNIVDLFMD